MTQTIEQLTARVRELERAESTLIKAGYTDCGGELWKPPLGESASHLLERISELEEENARLKRTNSSYANLTKAQESQLTNLRQRLYQLKGADSAIDSERQANCELTEQLAASQLHAEQLLEALEKLATIANQYAGHYPYQVATVVDAAISLPADTSALDAYVAEKVKEASTQLLEKLEQLTRQRDLAVDALKKAVDMVSHPDNIALLQQAIQESEGK